MPGESAHAREHAVVADPAVVGDVEAVLDQVVVPERGDAAVIGQSDVDRHVLADLVVLADHELAGAAVEAEHLRRQPDHRERVDPRARADPRAARDAHLRADLDARAELDLAPDRRERSDRHVVGELGPRIDYRGRMDVRHGSAQLFWLYFLMIRSVMSSASRV